MPYKVKQWVQIDPRRIAPSQSWHSSTGAQIEAVLGDGRYRVIYGAFMDTAIVSESDILYTGQRRKERDAPAPVFSNVPMGRRGIWEP